MLSIKICKQEKQNFVVEIPIKGRMSQVVAEAFLIQRVICILAHLKF